MMNEHLRNGLRVGVIFAIATIFLILIAFNVTAAELLGKLLGNQSASSIFGLTPDMFNMLVFFGLLGLWAGGMGARRTPPDTWNQVLLAGLSAGLLFGALVAVFAYLVGMLNVAGVQMTSYLPLMLPASIEQLLTGKSPITGSIILLAVIFAAGVLGALMARGIGRGAWRQSYSAWWGQRKSTFSQAPTVQRVRGNALTRYLSYGVLLLLVFLLPLWIGQYWNYTLGTVGIYVLLGLGLNIVVGLAGLLDLGYVAFFAIGAYTVALLTAPTPHNLLWNFWIVLPIGIVLAATTGVLLGIPVLRMRGDYLAIVTLGFGEIIRILSKSDLLTNFSGGPKGVPNVGGPSLFGITFNDIGFVYLILIAVLLIIFITNRLQDSRVGRAWVAMREDETVAQAMGINTLRFKLLAFGIGAAFAGLGGAIFASRNQFTGPEDFNLMVSINVLCVVIVGGMGSIPGVIAGAFALKGLPEVLRELENYRVMFFGALLVVMMVLRPEGLLPSKRRRLEMREIAEEEGAEEAVKQARVGPPATASPPLNPGNIANISTSDEGGS
jgi:ABC-type branched-subunit amino acid transport system permease subunit